MGRMVAGGQTQPSIPAPMNRQLLPQQLLSPQPVSLAIICNIWEVASISTSQEGKTPVVAVDYDDSPVQWTCTNLGPEVVQISEHVEFEWRVVHTSKSIQ